MILYLNGYYQLQLLPCLDIESGQLLEIGEQQLLDGKKNDNNISLSITSTRNLVLSSQLCEKTSSSQLSNGIGDVKGAVSISKIIETRYSSKRKQSKSKSSPSSSSNTKQSDK